MEPLKAFKHGAKYNYLFPRAATDLDRFLRDAQKAEAVRRGPIAQNGAIWDQVQGILNALDKMSDGFQLEDGDDARLVGQHFDLKPANILIDDDNTWRISDFGQASLRQRAGSSPSITNQGGSDPYSAPEIEQERASTRYDVWSMGCILLEILAFMVYGVAGLTEESTGLDKVRKTRPQGARGEDARLWERAASPHSTRSGYVVKGEIKGFMERLGQSDALDCDLGSRGFVERLLMLIEDMLIPDFDARAKMKDVYLRFRDIRAHAETEVGPSAREIPRGREGEHEIAREYLEDRR